MIIKFLLAVLIMILSGIFSWLPQVTKLPVILGVDIDAATVSGIGQFHSFTQAFWPFEILFQGFLVLVAYFVLKMGLQFFLGSRTPGK